MENRDLRRLYIHFVANSMATRFPCELNTKIINHILFDIKDGCSVQIYRILNSYMELKFIISKKYCLLVYFPPIPMYDILESKQIQRWRGTTDAFFLLTFGPEMIYQETDDRYIEIFDVNQIMAYKRTEITRNMAMGIDEFIDLYLLDASLRSEEIMSTGVSASPAGCGYVMSPWINLKWRKSDFAELFGIRIVRLIPNEYQLEDVDITVVEESRRIQRQFYKLCEALSHWSLSRVMKRITGVKNEERLFNAQAFYKYYYYFKIIERLTSDGWPRLVDDIEDFKGCTAYITIPH